MKQVLFHGLTAGLLAGAASTVYNSAYSAALLADFSQIVNVAGIFGACIFGCVVASLGYHFLRKLNFGYTDVLFNIIFLIITFASFYPSFAMSLPVDIESPELFAGLVIPMHLFPVLFWLAAKPLFYKADMLS